MFIHFLPHSEETAVSFVYVRCDNGNLAVNRGAGKRFPWVCLR